MTATLRQMRAIRRRKKPLKRAAIERLSVADLYTFVRYMWSEVEPGVKLSLNWHIEAVCKELEAVTRGEVRDLVICIPPGHMKSLLVSVFWPAWQWLRRPTERMLFISGDDDVAIRDSRRMRTVVRSDRYRRLLCRIKTHDRPEWSATLDKKRKGSKREGSSEPWRLAKDQDEKVNFANELEGFRQCRSLRGKVTGKRADGIVVDDPVDVKEVLLGSPERIAARMLEVLDIYDKVLSSRVNDPRKAYRVVIMQRLHEADLAGVLVNRDGVRAVVIPTEYDPDPDFAYEHDPRTEEGELLFPEIYSRDVVEKKIKVELGPLHYAAQHGQRPAPGEGLLFKAGYWKHFSEDPMKAKFDSWIISVDCSFKDKKDSDFVVIQCFGLRGTDKYLLDQIRKRMDFGDTLIALIDFCKKWRRARTKIIEDKANGSGIISTIKGKIGGVYAYNPTDSKYARAQVSANANRDGEVYLPLPIYAPWIEDYKAEHQSFPTGKNDDQVDATSQLVIYVADQNGGDPLKRLKEQFSGFLAA